MEVRNVTGAALRGAVGAMAMTGMRRLTTGLGLVEQTPPEAVAEEGVPSLFRRVPPERRDEALELAHWAFGAVAGALFALLPRSLRRSRAAGPGYGLAIWALFEAAVAPALGLRRSQEPRRQERLAIAADHVLYGAVLAGDRRD